MKYVFDRRKKPRILKDDIDPFLNDYEDSDIETLSKLALDCMDDQLSDDGKTVLRPTALDAIKTLQTILPKYLYNVSPEQLDTSASQRWEM